MGSLGHGNRTSKCDGTSGWCEKRIVIRGSFYHPFEFTDLLEIKVSFKVNVRNEVIVKTQSTF